MPIYSFYIYIFPYPFVESSVPYVDVDKMKKTGSCYKICFGMLLRVIVIESYTTR